MSEHARLLDRRRSGVLLHPTSLISGEGDHRRGALGGAARNFIDWMVQAGFTVWQVLPLGPPGDGGSPYWARSDFAGDSSLIDRSELPNLDQLAPDYQAFRAAARGWLDDYVIFESMAAHFASAWWDWPQQYRVHDARALEDYARQNQQDLERRRIEQWQFDWQWRALRRYAADRGIYLLGDLPIYVSPDSVATWSDRAQFQLDNNGRPALLAGVPPDYFSADGQLWGNPLYNWEQAQRDQFSFWRTRLARQLQRFDLLRIDHFRGLAGYWAVPAGARTAREGHWCPAPGQALFRLLQQDFPTLPLIAEDLGVITPDVEELRVSFRLPGMRVLQFGFDGAADNPHLPHNYTRDLVAYTGTHDNDTTQGWCQSLTSDISLRVQAYLSAQSNTITQNMERTVLASVAQLAILPAQDLLRLGSQARLNTPGTATGNWQWRLPPGSLDASLAQPYAELNHIFGRSSA